MIAYSIRVHESIFKSSFGSSSNRKIGEKRRKELTGQIKELEKFPEKYRSMAIQEAINSKRSELKSLGGAVD